MNTDRNTGPLPRRAPEDFLELIERQRRGRLKIYLGSAAGVGKTYEMLQEGNRLRARDIDVVVGYVEPHPRPETLAQIGTLEVIPPRRWERGGSAFQEMDVDAILARKPAVVLVDELAHTNAEGSRNAKRYQDVEELLAAGIHVLTTLNVQHLESVYNLVEEATEVCVRERVPDELIAQADQIINVDLPAEDLIDRLNAGKIYPPEQASRALENFFTVDNLTFLRELALGETAKQLEQYSRKTHAPGDSQAAAVARVVVGLSSSGPDPERLLRKTARLADDLNNADWFAVYVRTPKEEESRLPAKTHQMLASTLDLAQKMGGSVVVLRNPSMLEALIEFAQEQGITHIVLGRPRSRSLLARLRPSVLEQLIEALPEVAIVVA